MKYNIGLYPSVIDPNLFGRVFAEPSQWTWRTLAKTRARYRRCNRPGP
jgi:hypothetical protein